MKAVILAGGLGTRLSEETVVRPKPMIDIGGKPILWHIMKIYAAHGFNEFVICLGYKGWMIKDFFLNYHAHVSDIAVNLGGKKPVVYYNHSDENNWEVHLVETGEESQTGARLWNARKHFEDCDMFSVTYGDGVADIDIGAVLESHKKSSLLGTITGVHPSGRFGEIETNGEVISEFHEKPYVSAGLINGGFMVFNKEVIDKYFRPGDDLILETEVLPEMVKDKQLGVYKHEGFWQCVDTLREYNMLKEMWKQNKAAWKIW